MVLCLPKRRRTCKILIYFMKTDDSIPYTQDLAIEPYHVPNLVLTFMYCVLSSLLYLG